MKKHLITIALVLSFVVLKAQSSSVKISPQDTTIYSAVEQSAQFPGDIQELYKFIGANLVYPDSAKKANIQGKVILSFVVEKEGNLSSFIILRGLTPEINGEAIRVMKLSPKWSPAKQNGVSVRQQYSFPISFMLKKDTIAIPEVFSRVEVQAEFPGGLDKLGMYLSKNLRYPAQARYDHIQGRVVVSFVVEKDGSLTDIKVIKGVSKELDEEALRLIKASPKWTPGQQNNQPVRSQFTFPISFALANN